MMSLTSEAIFIDTNVLIYANIAQAPLHTPALQAIQNYEAQGIELWISRQVLREYLAVLSRPQTFGSVIPATILSQQVQLFERRFRVANEQAETTAHLLDLIQQITVGGKQIHDANIVATMQSYGITRLLTNNPADFNRFTHLITVISLDIGA